MTETDEKSPATRASLSAGWWVAFTLAGVFVVAVHLFRLDTVPQGVFFDESSIGINAADIAKSGRDQYGAVLPVYFRAFGEYKNPIYIYVVALIFKVLGVSVWTLRFTSVFFLVGAVTGVFLAIRRLFPSRPAIALYSILAMGFLPHYFNLSRVAFEVISQVALVCWALYALTEAFPEDRAPNRRWAMVTGLLLGASTYAYSTGRLLMPLLVVLCWAAYGRREHWKALLTMTAAWAVTLVPLLAFAVRNPGSLSARFDYISYLGSPTLTVAGKIMEFFRQYSDYWTLRFLVFDGDANRRHTTGWGGLVFVTVLILAAVGLIRALTDRDTRSRGFVRLLVGLLVLAPIGAALTKEGAPHSLRADLESVPLLFLSCFGLDAWLGALSQRRRVFLTFGVFLVLCTEIGAYLRHYFEVYPAISAPAFGTDGLAEMLTDAVPRQPRRIYVTGGNSLTLANLQFLQLALSIPQGIDLRQGTPLPNEPDTCTVYYQGWDPPRDSGYRRELPGFGARLYCSK